MIRNLADLAAHLGVTDNDTDGDLEQRIAHRLYRQTECGVSFWHRAGGGYLTKERRVCYIVGYVQTITGWALLRWRSAGRAWSQGPLPPALAEYVQAARPGRVDYDVMAVPADRFVSRRGAGYHVLVTVEVTEQRPTRRRDYGSVVVVGYCEGDVGDCPPRELRFPFTGEDFDALVEAADRDGCDLWDETHGCPQCFGGYDYDEGGTNPVDPDCSACGGDGVVI